jgi:hypothetical protein
MSKGKSYGIHEFVEVANLCMGQRREHGIYLWMLEI